MTVAPFELAEAAGIEGSCMRCNGYSPNGRVFQFRLGIFSARLCATCLAVFGADTAAAIEEYKKTNPPPRRYRSVDELLAMEGVAPHVLRLYRAMRDAPESEL